MNLFWIEGKKIHVHVIVYIQYLHVYVVTVMNSQSVMLHHERNRKLLPVVLQKKGKMKQVS